MATLALSEPIPLDLTVGFEWHAVLSLSYYPPGNYVFFEGVTPAGQRTVIFEAASPTGTPKITLGLDEHTNLFLRVTDIESKEHTTPLFRAVELLHLAHLGFCVGPTGRGTTQLSIWVNDVVRAHCEVTANFGGVAHVNVVVGSDINNKQNISLVMAEFGANDRLLTNQERGELHAYLQNKHQTLPAINENHLLEADRRARAQFPEADILGRTVLVAINVLVRFFGHPWVRDNVLKGKSLNTFFARADSSPLADHRRSSRVTRLAELIFRFQSLPGLLSHVGGLQKEGIEPTAAEFEAADILSRAGVPFVFEPPAGERSCDIKIDGGELWIPCEVKCKTADTTLSEETILRSLKKAARKIPDGGPGIVMMKLPEEWAKSPLADTFVAGALADFFRSYTRVDLVVFFWEVWFEAGVTNSIGLIRARAESNPSSKHRDLVNSCVKDRLLKLAQLAQQLPVGQLGYFATFLAAHSQFIPPR